MPPRFQLKERKEENAYFFKLGLESTGKYKVKNTFIVVLEACKQKQNGFYLRFESDRGALIQRAEIIPLDLIPVMRA